MSRIDDILETIDRGLAITLTTQVVDPAPCAPRHTFPCVAEGCDRAGTHWLLGLGEFCPDHRPGPRRNVSLDFSDEELHDIEVPEDLEEEDADA